MTLRVVGAGLGRTGTASLKEALERLLGAPCHHMKEVLEHPEQVPGWAAAARGEPVDWAALMDGYAASVDWPSAAFWPELAEAFPDAVILHSVRPFDAWWESASQTIFPAVASAIEGANFLPGWSEMIDALFSTRFTRDLRDREAVRAAFERHDAEVRERAPADRLLVWTPADGWAPLCAALGVPIPDAPFPRTNTRQEFLANLAEMAAAGGSASSATRSGDATS